MDQRFMLAISCHHIEDDPLYNKIISKKGLFPFGSNIGFLSANANITLKFRNSKGELVIDDNIKMQSIKNLYCLNTEDYILNDINQLISNSNYIFIIIEGSSENARIILCFDIQGDDVFSQIRNENPALRLEMYNLPPLKITVVNSANIESVLYSFYSLKDQELFSVHANRFLKNPHILTYLFSHVMSLKSKDHLHLTSFASLTMQVSSNEPQHENKIWIEKVAFQPVRNTSQKKGKKQP